MRLGLTIGLMLWLIAIAMLQGCAFTGTKSVDIWGLKWENFAGVHVEAGYNAIDQVKDFEGVGNGKPEKY